MVPVELAEELFDKLTAYYADDENVTVIVDRRRNQRRARGASSGVSPDGEHVRTLRDRRQRSATDRLPLSLPLPRIDGSV